jgi:hypothetical protein
MEIERYAIGDNRVVDVQYWCAKLVKVGFLPPRIAAAKSVQNPPEF